MNLQTKKAWVSGSHRDPSNKILTQHGGKYGILLDKDAEGRKSFARKTKAGTVVFEDGMAVVPDDLRGNEIAAELKEESRYPGQVNYHPGREAMSLHRDHQVMWRVPAWNWQCKVEGCRNEAAIQRLCDEHWGNYA